MHGGSPPTSLSWSEHPLREMCRLAWPIAISMLSYTAMTVADTAFVAGEGAAALAGVGLGVVVFMALVCFPLGLLRATKVLVAQAVGAGRRHATDEYLSAALLIAASMSGLVVALGLVGAPLATAMAPSAAASEATTIYLRIRILSAPLFFGFAALREYSYGVGNSRAPMYASVAANIVNIGLDYLLVCTMSLGVAGAAWATVVGVAVETAVISVVLRGRTLSRGGARGRLRSKRAARPVRRASWWLPRAPKAASRCRSGTGNFHRRNRVETWTREDGTDD